MRLAETRLKRSDDQLLRLVSFGVFLLILGIIVLATPNLSAEIRAFFGTSNLSKYSPAATSVFLFHKARTRSSTAQWHCFPLRLGHI
jgi:hypothetical protein